MSTGGVLGEADQTILDLLGGGQGLDVLGGRLGNGIGVRGRKGDNGKGRSHLELRLKERRDREYRIDECIEMYKERVAGFQKEVK